MEFRPHPAMKKFLSAIAFWVILFGVLSWSIPLTIATSSTPTPSVVVHLATLIAIVVLVIWIPRYYESVTYRIDDEWLYAEGGTLWKRRSRLPISRVQMVNVMQGPWQRRYGLGSVRIYTAATGQSTAELSFANVTEPELVRDRVLALVHAQRSDPTGLGDDESSSSAEVTKLLAALLQEVRAIRQKTG
ncbi:MAG: PH domain-containing protein [Limnochordia bacterium]